MTSLVHYVMKIVIHAQLSLTVITMNHENVCKSDTILDIQY